MQSRLDVVSLEAEPVRAAGAAIHVRGDRIGADEQAGLVPETNRGKIHRTPCLSIEGGTKSKMTSRFLEWMFFCLLDFILKESVQWKDYWDKGYDPLKIGDILWR